MLRIGTPFNEAITSPGASPALSSSSPAVVADHVDTRRSTAGRSQRRASDLTVLPKMPNSEMRLSFGSIEASL